MEERLNELQKEVSIKGFRPGKVPSSVIKNQFGKSIYGEIIDKILRESSSKAILGKKLKVAGQPKIDLNNLVKAKILIMNYKLIVYLIIKLNSLKRIKAVNLKSKLKKVIDNKLKEISVQNKQFKDKKDHEASKIGDQMIFDYSATAEGVKFEGSVGKGVQIELGKDLFLKGFDQQLVGVKKGETKIVNAVLPENHPKKELANKKTKFECKILNVKECS